MSWGNTDFKNDWKYNTLVKKMKGSYCILNGSDGTRLKKNVRIFSIFVMYRVYNYNLSA